MACFLFVVLVNYTLAIQATFASIQKKKMLAILSLSKIQNTIRSCVWKIIEVYFSDFEYAL